MNLAEIKEDEVMNESVNHEDLGFMESLLKQKKGEPSKFESYWEKDENDIESWTNEQIESDQRKQLIAHSECSYEKVFSLLEGRDKNSLRELLTYQDSDGYTALHRAAYTNQLAIVRLLLSFEKQPGLEDLHQLHKKTEMGWTPFHSAAFWNAYEVVDYFIKYAPDCDVNAQTNSGQTALHLCASKNDCMETTIILLNHPSADFSTKNNQNETALNIAARSTKFNGLYEITENCLNII